MNDEIKISLDSLDFKDLIRGEVVIKTVGTTDVKIILKDIGYYIMNKHIMQAREDLSINKR